MTDPSVVAALQAENERLIKLLEGHGIAWRSPQQNTHATRQAESPRLSTAEKVALFRRLFRGLTDVYPVRWESKTSEKSGYAPACANEWRAGVCEKPRIKCADCSNRSLTGARDSAIASMKLKHIDLVAGCVNQDAREVKTKFTKTFTTYFFPVGDDVRRIVEDWVAYLQQELLWGNDDPLFPATRIVVGSTSQFEAGGLERAHWSSAARIRTIFRDAFAGAGLPYFNPHSFRNTLVRLGQTVCRTPEEFKAWSQNLGHDKVLTTFLSYGQVANPRQGQIIKGLAAPTVHVV